MPRELPEKRRADILRLVQADGSASVVELSRRLGVSLSTVRRDLDHLTELGHLARSHGGAMVSSIGRSTFEPRREIVASTASAEKAAIGRFASGFVSDGQCVAFDSGSTVAEVARAVAERKLSITAVTNDLRIAMIFAMVEHVNLVVLGGTLRPMQYTLLGEPGISFLAGLHVDVAFIGVHSMHRAMLTETSIEVADMKVHMLKAARTPVLVADSTKFEAHAFREVAALQDFKHLVTDDRISGANLDLLRKSEVEVHLAAVGGTA